MTGLLAWLLVGSLTWFVVYCSPSYEEGICRYVRRHGRFPRKDVVIAGNALIALAWPAVWWVVLVNLPKRWGRG